MKLKLEDGVKIGLCAKGQRRFCKAIGIDFREFARDGIDVEKVQGIDDANLKRALAAAKLREAGHGR